MDSGLPLGIPFSSKNVPRGGDGVTSTPSFFEFLFYQLSGVPLAPELHDFGADFKDFGSDFGADLERLFYDMLMRFLLIPASCRHDVAWSKTFDH